MIEESRKWLRVSRKPSPRIWDCAEPCSLEFNQEVRFRESTLEGETAGVQTWGTFGREWGDWLNYRWSPCRKPEIKLDRKMSTDDRRYWQCSKPLGLQVQEVITSIQLLRSRSVRATVHWATQPGVGSPEEAGREAPANTQHGAESPPWWTWERWEWAASAKEETMLWDRRGLLITHQCSRSADSKSTTSYSGPRLVSTISPYLALWMTDPHVSHVTNMFVK